MNAQEARSTSIKSQDKLVPKVIKRIEADVQYVSQRGEHSFQLNFGSLDLVGREKVRSHFLANGFWISSSYEYGEYLRWDPRPPSIKKSIWELFKGFFSNPLGLGPYQGF